MKLEIQIENVAAPQAHHYFVALQLDYNDSNLAPCKLRTEISQQTNRPRFTRNLFVFDKIADSQTLKFGLMAAPGSDPNSAAKATAVGIGSIRLGLSRLQELPPEGTSKLVSLLSSKKETGQLLCKIRFLKIGPNITSSSSKVKEQYSAQFNPLISRVLYSEQAAKDESRLRSSLQQLEKQSAVLFASFKSLKEQEGTLQKIHAGVLRDQEEVRDEIELNERINEKISLKMAQRESAQALQLEIQMLRNSEEGQRLLAERLDYYGQRIAIEQEEHQRLSAKYQRVKNELQARIKRAEDYAEKLRGKDLQNFELSKNRQILAHYEQIEYQFNCNQHLIDQLVSSARTNELTAHQASLILSQVNHCIKLEQVGNGAPLHDSMLQLIEKEVEGTAKQEEQESEEEKMVLSIKLGALKEEINAVRSKIQQALSRKQMQESGVRRM